MPPISTAIYSLIGISSANGLISVKYLCYILSDMPSKNFWDNPEMLRFGWREVNVFKTPAKRGASPISIDMPSGVSIGIFFAFGYAALLGAYVTCPNSVRHKQ